MTGSNMALDRPPAPVTAFAQQSLRQDHGVGQLRPLALLHRGPLPWR